MMTEDRFTHLLDAYGASLSRWPEAEQEAGRLALQQPQMAALWAEASVLEDMLATPAIVPSADLRERVIISAIGAGLRERTPRRSWFNLWSGAGVAATAVAGAVLGVVLAQHMNAPVYAETVFYQASLQGTDDTEVLGMEMASLETMR